MTDPTASAAPGWYPDGSGGQRWWDGRAWTDHVAPATAPAAAGAPGVRTRLADDLKVDGVWVWLLATVQLVVSIPLIFLFDFRGYMYASITGDVAMMMSSIGIYLVLSILLGWGSFAFVIVAAYRDHKHLVALGVERPFHWAFAFIGVLVYLIGRHVILRKVTKTPGWPLWTNIALYVVLLIVIGVWAASWMSWLFTELPYLVGYGY